MIQYLFSLSILVEPLDTVCSLSPYDGRRLSSHQAVLLSNARMCSKNGYEAGENRLLFLYTYFVGISMSFPKNVVLILALSSLLFQSALACSCMKRSIMEEYQATKIIFIGTPTTVWVDPDTKSGMATSQVQKMIKGWHAILCKSRLIRVWTRCAD